MSSDHRFALRVFYFCWAALLLATPALPQAPQSLSYAEIVALKQVLSNDEKKDFERAGDPQAQALWARRYWKQRDPTPTTPENERYLEFLRRLDHAQKWYAAPTEEGFDDRGRIYIKYGEPAERFTQPIGDRVVKPNESWSYSNIHPGLVFDFVSRGTYYRLVDDLSQAITARSEPTLELANLMRMYEERSYVDPVYERVAENLRESSNLGYGSLAAINYARQYLTESVSRTQEVRAKLPAAVYSYDYEARPLAIAEYFARFRGRNGNIHLEVYFGVPYSQLAFTSEKGGWATALSGRITISDQAYRVVAADSMAGKLFAPNEATLLHGAYISQFNFEIPPGDYSLALRLENSAARRLGILKTALLCPPYPTDKLAMSDLQLSSQITMLHDTSDVDETPTGRALARFTKHNMRIAPLPGLSIDKSQTLFVYFEIYNLSVGADGTTAYTLNYKLQTLQGGRRYPGLASRDQKAQLSITENRTGHQQNPHEFIGIDLSLQTPGNYLLTVEVQDKSSAQTTSASVPIHVASRSGK